MRAGIINFSPRSRPRRSPQAFATMAPTKKSSSAKAPAKKPMVVKKSQYELERDARIKRNEEWMIAHGFNPYGSGPLKEIKKKAPPRPRTPKKYVPESQRRRSARLQGGTAGPERLTYDNWSDDERPRQRSRGSGGRRTRKNRLVELSEEQRAALESFNIYDFEASASASFTKPRHRRDGVITSSYTHRFMEPDGEHPVSEQNRRSVIRQVRKLVGRGRDLRLLAGRRGLPQGRAGDHAVGHLGDHRGRQGLRGPIWRRPGPRLAPQPPAPEVTVLPALPRHEGAARARGQGDDADEEGQEGQEDDRGLKGTRSGKGLK